MNHAKAALVGLSTLLGATPIAFGMIRATATRGRDLRYLAVAIATLVAATVVMESGRASIHFRRALVTLTAFVVATLLGGVVARLFGVRMAPVMWMVVASFALCATASRLLGGRPK